MDRSVDKEYSEWPTGQKRRGSWKKIYFKVCFAAHTFFTFVYNMYLYYLKDRWVQYGIFFLQSFFCKGLLFYNDVNSHAPPGWCYPNIT